MTLYIHSPDELIAALTHLLGFNPDDSIVFAPLRADLAIVCMTSDHQAADLITREFAVRLDSIGIDTPLKLSADESRWYGLDSGDSDLQTEAARDRLTATTVLAGRARPATSRDSLATSLVGEREPVAKLLSETREGSNPKHARVGGPVGTWATPAVPR